MDTSSGNDYVTVPTAAWDTFMDQLQKIGRTVGDTGAHDIRNAMRDAARAVNTQVARGLPGGFDLADHVENCGAELLPADTVVGLRIAARDFANQYYRNAVTGVETSHHTAAYLTHLHVRLEQAFRAQFGVWPVRKPGSATTEG